ncbi:hypothetical protein LCGC14_2431390, partial [marine sediment metagenome]
MDWNLELEPFQMRFFESTARHPNMTAAWGTGKRLDINEVVKIRGGWKKLAGIEEGDYVYGMDGQECLVTKAHDIVEVSVAYKLRFDSGEEILADPEHLWYTISSRENLDICRGMRFGGSVKTTQDIIGSIRTKNDYESNHRIPICSPFTQLKRFLPIRPYTFGAWLGDGSSREMSITNEDFEVLESITLDGYI